MNSYLTIHRFLFVMGIGVSFLAGCDGSGGGSGGNTGGTGGDTSTGGATTGGSGTGASGGGPSCDSGCGPDEYCESPYYWCPDKLPISGVETFPYCESRTVECNADLPVCGCDGQVYESECAAHAAGIDMGAGESAGAICDLSLTPEGRFPCGPWYCDPTNSYCFEGLGDTGDRDHACTAIPAECNGVPACSCLPQPGESTCSEVQGNGVTGFMVTQIYL